MLRITSYQVGLPVFKALSSETRTMIMDLLMRNGSMSMTALAEALHLTAGSLTPHIRMLQDCGLVHVAIVPGRHGALRICSAATDSLLVLPPVVAASGRVLEAEVGIGQYTGYDVRPTCGLSTPEHIIGTVDDPAAFAEPEHSDAQILWFGSGYVEYMLPCFLQDDQRALELQISMEISSEAPGHQEDWPSDICFTLNGVEVGSWLSPGDFGRIQGIYNPAWWNRIWNQHGLFKILSINEQGTFIDGARIGEATIRDICISPGKAIAFRISSQPDGTRRGGVTLFGRGFGNYPQDIRMRLHYAAPEHAAEEASEP